MSAVRGDEERSGRPAHDPARPAVSAVPQDARAFQGRRAGIVTRLLANIIDFGVVVGVLVGGYLAVAAVQFLVEGSSFRPPTPSFGLVVALGSGVFVVYFTLAWATTGRTYGDQVLGLRVVGFRGTRLRFPAALVRAVMCTYFMVGVLWVAVSRENRSVQDVLLRTSVIYDWQPKPPRGQDRA